MTSSEKKVIFTLIGIFVAILLIVLIVKGTGNNEDLSNVPSNNEVVNNSEKYVTDLANDVKLNTSKDLNSVKMYKNIEISNIQFTSKNGNSTLLADLKNTGSTKQEEEIVTITILDENNAKITSFNTILAAIEPGKTERLEAIITADIVNAKDFTISEKQ